MPSENPKVLISDKSVIISFPGEMSVDYQRTVRERLQKLTYNADKWLMPKAGVLVWVKEKMVSATGGQIAQ